MSNSLKCPKCGSHDIKQIKDSSEYARDGFFAILGALINPSAAHAYAHQALKKHRNKCNRCGHIFD
jgi:ribosomal protein S27AE